MKPEKCPNCEKVHTERVNTEFWQDQIQATRICNNCPTQYDVMYCHPYKDNVTVMDE